MSVTVTKLNSFKLETCGGTKCAGRNCSKREACLSFKKPRNRQKVQMRYAQHGSKQEKYQAAQAKPSQLGGT